ncbi:MAG: glycosyltransferase family 2 protein [Desulfobulbaceae bacterium]|nr:MAG: glycosyltransferase family 2 protein [Desulfobulbaceae bacterium]
METNSLVVFEGLKQPSRVFIAHHWRKPPSISIVIPIQNEDANIAPLLAEIKKHLDGRYDYEVIFVDDHSTDETVTILRELAAEFPIMRPIRLNRRCGQSGALLEGVKAARAQLIVTLDGDGQNDPADIDALIRCYDQTASYSPRCLIIGYRRSRQDSIWRRFSSKIADTVRGMVLRDSTPDGDCGIKVFSRGLFLELPAFNHMDRFLPALARQFGGTVVSVEVHHRPKKNGSSHYGALDKLAEDIVDLLGVVWLGRRAINTEVSKERTRTHG